MKRTILAGLVVLVGCGDDGRNMMLPNADGSVADARIIADADLTDANLVDAMSDAATDPDGPAITVLSPSEPASGDYTTAALVTHRAIAVSCEVLANATSGDLVDPSSVKVTVTGGGASVEAAAAPSGAPGEFVGNVNLAGFENGPIAVICTASDLGDEPKTNSGQNDTFLDLGPRVDVFNPVVDASYGGAVAISFTVLPDPVDGSDTGAGVGTVEASVSGVDVTLANPSTGVYTATVPFDDPEFVPPLDGDVSLNVRASNTRTSSAVTRDLTIAFKADNDGPSVSITSPGAGALVSGFITISASVNDTAGVAAVTATIDEFEIELQGGGSSWSALFDTRLLDGIYPLLQVRAIDIVGNEAASGQVIALDNRPPVVDLDSVNVREAICVNNTTNCSGRDPYECGKVFDPLGADAVNDGQTVGQLSELRVRAEDQANIADDGTYGVAIPIADLDQGSVRIMILDDITLPLLVDLDEDGFCDAINPAVEPKLIPQASNEAAVVQMGPVSPGGSSHHNLWDVAKGVTTGLDDSDCWEPETVVAAPPNLCLFSDTTRQISTSYNKAQSAIYGIPPITTDSCNGNAFDSVASNISDGWACVAAIAEDNLGNIGVSAPLRVCFDDEGDGFLEDGTTAIGDQGCASIGNTATPGNRPSCTQACTPVSFVDLPTKNILYLNNEVRECSDGADNDGDGDTDWPDDSDACTGPNDNAELGPPPP